MNALTPFELKAQAHRLSDALSALNMQVTHAQALDLIGRVHGKRDWRELVGTLHQLNVTEVPVTEEGPSPETQAFLQRLEAALRDRDFEEGDLDGMVHDRTGHISASDINNSGMAAQLAFLRTCVKTDKDLLLYVQDELGLFEFDIEAAQ